MADTIVTTPNFSNMALPREALDDDKTVESSSVEPQLNGISPKVLDLSTIAFNYPELEGDVKECFQYDLVALLFSMFSNIEDQVPMDKFEQALTYTVSFNTNIILKVRQERFHPLCAFMEHEPTDMSVAQCMKYMTEYFKHQIEVIYTPELKKITMTSGDNMERDLHDFVYRFAVEMAPLIIPCWRHINVTYSEEARESIECVVM